MATKKKSAYVENWKLVKSVGDDEEIGFRLPGEETASLSESTKSMLIERFPDWPTGGDMTDVNSSTKRRLQNLGYMEE